MLTVSDFLCLEICVLRWFQGLWFMKPGQFLLRVAKEVEDSKARIRSSGS